MQTIKIINRYIDEELIYKNGLFAIICKNMNIRSYAAHF